MYSHYIYNVVKFFTIFILIGIMFNSYQTEVDVSYFLLFETKNVHIYFLRI